MRIDRLIDDHRHEIRRPDRLNITPAQWENISRRLRAFLDAAGGAATPQPECYDEQLWTFLVACGYAVAEEAGLRSLCRQVTGDPGAPPTPLWLEALPVPPRHREGNTNLDLACGAIAARPIAGKAGGLGIRYDPAADHIAFCEMKWYSDISKSVTHDQTRNQLARVIENALTFQGAGCERPSRCTVTLVTPAAFKAEPKSRLYHYKFDEYSAAPQRLLDEFARSDATMPRRGTGGWRYPADIGARLGALRLRWITFEGLIGSLPQSPLDGAIRTFSDRHNGSARTSAAGDTLPAAADPIIPNRRPAAGEPPAPGSRS